MNSRRRGFRREREALFEGAVDEIDVAGVGVNRAHEFFEALAGRTVHEAEIVRNGRLDVFGEDIRRPADEVVEFVADAEQVIVGGFELFALGLADEFALLQFGEGTGAVFEEGHPDEVLVIAQAAAAVLDVGLLHGGGIAEFVVAGGLVIQAGGDVFVLVTINAFVDDGLLQFFEQGFAAGDEPRLDEGGFGLHVVAGGLDAILDAADGMPDLETEVPERVEDAIHEPGQEGERFVAGDDLAVVEEHEIDVAVGIEFGAAITADGDEGDGGGILFLAAGREVGHNGVPHVTEEDVEEPGAGAADIDATGAGAMEDFEPVGFHLQKRLVAGEFRGGKASRRQREGGWRRWLRFFR